MEIINRSTESVKKFATEKLHTTVFFSAKGRIRLSAKLWQAIPKSENPMYIHFVTDVDRLYFYVNSNILGFTLREHHGGKKGKWVSKSTYAVINSPAAVESLQKKLSTLITGRSYPVRKSNVELGGEKLWEIELHKKVTNKTK